MVVASVRPRLTVGLLLLLAVGIRAQETPPPTVPESEVQSDPDLDREIRRLDTVLVTATRHSAEPFDLPYRVSVPDPETRRSARVLQDALKAQPGIVVQRTSYGQSSPFLRNLTGYHTLLLINGIRFNNSIWRFGPNEYWGTVDGLSLDQLEVVMGPSSVLYGSDAVGGTVNAVPLRRQIYGETSFDQRAFVRYSSAENSLLVRGELSGNLGDVFGFVVGVTGGSFDDLEAGGDVDTQKGTGYSELFGDGSFDFRLDDHWTLGLLTQSSWLNGIGRQHRTASGVSYHGTVIGNDRRHDLDFERHLNAISLEGEELDGFFDRAVLRLSWQELEEHLDRIRNNGAREKQGFDVTTLGIGLELTSNTVIGRLTYGADYYRDDVDSYRKNYNAAGTLTSAAIQGPVGDEGTYDLLGVFVQDEIAITDSLGLILGARFTYAAAEADRVQDPQNSSNEIELDDDWTNLVGSARLLYEACAGLHLYGGASQAFRAPNLSDLTRFDIAQANELEVPTPDLDPEHFLTLEVGAKVQTSSLDADLTYFYTVIDDLIIRSPTGAVSGTNAIVAKSNEGDGHLQGIEFRARYEFDENWSARGTFFWTDGQLDAFPTSDPASKQRDVFTRLAPIQGSLGVRWQTSDGAFYVQPSALIVDKQERLSSSDQRDTQRIPPGGSPGYTIWNLEMGYHFDESKHVFLSVENLGDKNYRVHGSGTQEAGLNFVLGFDLKF